MIIVVHPKDCLDDRNNRAAKRRSDHRRQLRRRAAFGLAEGEVTNAPPSEMGEAFSLQYLSAELRCKCFSGGEVRKAPSNEIVLIVAATRTALVFDPVLMVKLVHVV
jgi:hypothetical protein